MISFKNLNSEKKFNCLVCGPDTTYYRKCFKNNFLYIDPSKNIFDKTLIFESIICFFDYIKKFKINYVNLRLILTLSLVIPILRKNNINKVICFFDYVLLGKALKKLLGKKIVLIGLQHSMRAAHMNRTKLISGYDYYFQWDEYKKKKKIKNCKFINFGSLKSHIVLERFQSWKLMKKQFSKVKNIILISSFGDLNINFDKKFFTNLNFDQKIQKAELLYEQFKEKKILLSIRESQALEYFLICYELKKIVEKFKLKLKIISRYEKSHLNFMEKSSKRLKQEEEFFDFFFEKYKIISANFYNKVKILFNYKSNSIIYTNISSLGKELLAMNFKTIFFSFISGKIHKTYYDKNSIFCCIKKESKLLEKKIDLLRRLKLNTFKEYKKKTLSTFNSFEPKKKNLEYFLNLTGLKIDKRCNLDRI